MWHAEYANESLAFGYRSSSSLQSSVRYPVLMEADASAGTYAGVHLTQRGSFATCQLHLLPDPPLRATRMPATRDQNLPPTLCTLYHYPISKVMPQHCVARPFWKLGDLVSTRGIANYCTRLASH